MITEFIAQIGQRMLRYFFDFDFEAPGQHFDYYIEPAPPPPVAMLPVPIKRPRKSPQRMGSTLADLLDGIETTFANLTRHDHANSWANRDLRTGLRRLGAHISCDQTRFAIKDNGGAPQVKLTAHTKFSGLLFVALNEGKHSNKNDIYFDFLYAQRLAKMPWDAEQLPGVAYQCGAAYRALNGKLWWTLFHVAVDRKTGEVRACHELMDTHVHVKSARESYVRREWKVSPVASDHWGNPAERNRVLALHFVEAFDLWNDKDGMWSIGVRKDGQRVTFCVPENQTKTYFKNREKTALTVAGKRRPIMHFVQEHERIITEGTTTVKAHLRGLRRFEWNGHHCVINAPLWHLNAVDFELESCFLEEHPELIRSQYITTSQLGKELAALEDAQR